MNIECSSEYLNSPLEQSKSFMDEFKGQVKWQEVVVGRRRRTSPSVSSPCVFLVNVNRFPIATIAVK